MAFYTDGFDQDKSLYDFRAVHGCYKMSMGFSIDVCRTSNGVKVLRVDLHWKNATDVLSILIENVITAAVEDIDGIDPLDCFVCIFIDAMPFFGDHQAIASGSDCLGKVRNAFWALYIVSYRKGTQGGEVAYTSALGSRRLPLKSTDDRFEAIRTSSVYPRFLVKIGLKSGNRKYISELALFRLSRLLKPERKHVILIVNGRLVTLCVFDSSLSSTAATHHLWVGLIKNDMTVCLSYLSIDAVSKNTGENILTAASAKGLYVNGWFLQWPSDAKYSGMNSMIMRPPFFRSVLRASNSCSIWIHRELHARSVLSNSFLADHRYLVVVVVFRRNGWSALS